MQQDIMSQGVDLMLFGMGTVFVFLTVLVIATTIMSSFVQRFLPEAPAPEPTAAPAAAAPTGVTDPKLLAIIKAAVDQHRAKHK
ncbi:OadG family protein [Pseudomaricurvus alkylphenolicus]|jgi:oxaloacetate decarboxylase gamma subunit|uniref:OadG family protein n=1 Tax=Pseudomaricurvus alkylphenolicus TaxID=1306991 RepID=UPI00141EDA0D|nr:OadG family protein [Pseudomaricurvus alkylphenolicus]NIB43029.1 OadG family protein [Pseudomaricurvus alkylphenolicus]